MNDKFLEDLRICVGKLYFLVDVLKLSTRIHCQVDETSRREFLRFTGD